VSSTAIPDPTADPTADPAADPTRRIPLTVIGGYLGAGKTTLLNHLLQRPGGRRLAVIVNDFGELGIDAALLGDRTSGVVNLPNGCVCCTLGSDLYTALRSVVDVSEPPDQIVVEASGVARPRAVAAWGTVPPFEPGGVIVLAAADGVRRWARDKYVGPEVLHQLSEADVVVVTKPDLVTPAELVELRSWCAAASDGAPVVEAVLGDLPADVVLGRRPAPVVAAGEDAHGHADTYSRWSWESSSPVAREAVDEFLAALPERVLRLKGFLALDDGTWVAVHVVGRRKEITPSPPRATSQLEAIAVGGPLDLALG
jgi:G3E family GTPase